MMGDEVVQPMPDEPAIAHAGRVAFFKGVSDKRAMDCWLAKAAAKAGVDERAPRLRQLAAVSGMSSTDYARQHSLLGVMRVAAKPEFMAAHGAEEGDGFSRRLGMLTQKSHAYLCQTCAKEDVEHWRFSWFRRIHQVQGVDWCPSHHLPLLKVTAKDPWSHLPQHWIEDGEIEDSHRPDAFEEGGFEARYIEIACELLEKSGPCRADALATALKSRARELKIRTSVAGVKGNLSDRVQEMAPDAWIGGAWPQLQSKAKGRFLEGLDSLLARQTGQVKGLAYVTAMTVMWDSSLMVHNLLRHLDSLQSSSPRMPQETRRINLPASYWQGEFWSVYLKNQGRVGAIATELGLDRSYVGEKLRQLGLPSLYGVSTASRWRALLRFQQGESMLIACQRENAKLEEVEALVRLSCARVASAAARVAGVTPTESNCSQPIHENTVHDDKLVCEEPVEYVSMEQA